MERKGRREGGREGGREGERESQRKHTSESGIYKKCNSVHGLLILYQTHQIEMVNITVVR